MKRMLGAFVLVALIGVAGCHRVPPYVGIYKLAMNDKVKALGGVLYSKAHGTGNVGRDMHTFNDETSKMALAITDDGKVYMAAPFGGGEALLGTYTASGNELTVTLKEGAPTDTLTFDEKNQTVTSKALPFVWKKQ
jgi:hypothetical protein